MSWSVIGPLAMGIVLIALVFWREIRAAVEVWDASTAYSHCYLILPMSIYLLWERRALLIGSKVMPELHLVWAAIPLTLFWLLAERLGIMEARQIALIAGFELLFLAVLGRQLFARIAGPLLFLLFLVPFGAFATPWLQQFTAVFSITGLNLLGIPNFSDGFTIETPAGVFFVAEACAGLRFLIAATSFGVFYSLLSFVSFGRRIVFVCASVVVPIIANGVRALGIVVLGQVLGSAEAAAADHIVYGWVFFSFVMLLLIAGGHMFREDISPLTASPSQVSTVSRYSPSWCVAGVGLLFVLGPGIAGIIDSRSVAPVMPDTSIIAAPPGCVSGKIGSGVANQRSYALRCDGLLFEVSVTLFAPRSTSSAMISERRRVTREVSAENSAVSAVEMSDHAGYWIMVQTTDPDRATAYSSWIDGVQMSSSFAGRIAQARNSILGAAYAPALITITIAEPVGSVASMRKDTLATLTRVVLAQADLTAKMAALTKIGGG